MRHVLRVIYDDALPGAVNMARDEALLEAVERGTALPTLRCYQWSTPTLSLGYFQRYEEIADAGVPPDIAVVRRTTGGGAIVHDRELTYALALPRSHPIVKDAPGRLYCVAHDAIASALLRWGVCPRRRDLCAGNTVAHAPSDDDGPRTGPGKRRDRTEPFICFARQHGMDLVIGPSKLAGSAQRRTTRAILQHGSIILGPTHAAQPSPRLEPTRPIRADELAFAVARELARGLDLTPHVGRWRADELRRAAALATRYNDPAWTRRR